MYKWIIILLVCFIVFLLGLVYICTRVQKFGIKSKVISFIIVLFFVVLLSLLLNVTSAIIAVIHYLIVWLVMDLIFYIIKKIRKKDFKVYLSGIFTLTFVSIYLIIGVYNVYSIKERHYNFTSSKLENKYKIALISDSHMGTTIDSSRLSKLLKEIKKNNPDMLLIAGDFVDDGTSKEEMIKSCEYLGKLKLKYGIYFVHGNHDKGYYESSKRGFDSSDLEEELEKNNVKVLKDEKTLINNEIMLVGRRDFEDSTRLKISDIINDQDVLKYTIIMDHEPTDYANEAKSNADLVVSGHTHGGQLFPLNYVGPIVNSNDLVYGTKKIKNTNFIVTSGVSDWEIKFKTGCDSEYIMININ